MYRFYYLNRVAHFQHIPIPFYSHLSTPLIAVSTNVCRMGFDFVQLQIGALIPWSVGLSVCLSVGQLVLKQLQNIITKVYKTLQNVTKCYKMLQNVTKCYKMLQIIEIRIFLYSSTPSPFHLKRLSRKLPWRSHHF